MGFEVSHETSSYLSDVVKADKEQMRAFVIDVTATLEKRHTKRLRCIRAAGLIGIYMEK